MLALASIFKWFLPEARTEISQDANVRTPELNKFFPIIPTVCTLPSLSPDLTRQELNIVRIIACLMGAHLGRKLR